MKKTLSFISVVLVFMIVFSGAVIAFNVSAAEGTMITYDFKNDNPGYAEGTLTFTADTADTFKLYWADDTGALDGYYPITEMTLSAGSSESFSFGYHTAIPAKATAVIAKDSLGNIAAEFVLPQNKVLSGGNLLYKFNSYSDVHIDNNGFYLDANTHWAEALKFSTDTEADFIVSSGDMVTNAAGPDGEWDIYERILADSDFVNPVYEANGNHDLRTGTESGIKSFVRASGTDNTIANYDANKPYYYVTEKNTGDIFIFMALESEFSPNKCDEFSAEQMAWLKNLLNTYYGTGINIYIVEHAPIEGFGAGDRMERPYYKALLSEGYMSTVQFKSLLIKYPKLIFMSGHTHEDFSMGYNFSDENGTACSMIHNSAVVGSTMAAEDDASLDYKNGTSYGKGYNSQGYLVEVYENSVVYYGANLTDELIYPAYCYIMDGARGTTPDATVQTAEPTTKDPTATTGATGCTLPEGVVTQRVYFANNQNWGTVTCHSWTTENETVTCTWPGYGAVYYGTDEYGVDLYYCDIPSEHTGIVWGNGNNGSQTVDITLDGTNNFFAPDTFTDGKYTVKASVWEYDEITEPSSGSEGTEPSSGSDVTENTSSENETSESSDEPILNYEIGDVNMDGKVSIRDVTTIQLKLVGSLDFDEQQQKLADTNIDGEVNINDATQIQLYLINKVTSLPFSSTKGAKYSAGASKDEAKSYLDAYYSFASYDQYQNLKKLYRNNASSAELDTAIASLKEIAGHIGAPEIYDVRDIYYFENTYNWSNVYAYAWTGSSNNASWPGVKMQKVGTNYGHDVYGIKFDYAGQFRNVIFNTGGGGSQTVDITLEKYEHNCFYLSGTGSDGKCTVGNFNFNSSVEPTIPTVPEQNVKESEHYLLMFYQSGVHGWSDKDKFFNYENGEYVLDYTTASAENISLSLYDNKTSKFKSVTASESMTYSLNESQSYTLTDVSSRGKSITISGLSVGTTLRFTFDPDTNKVTITCL